MYCFPFKRGDRLRQQVFCMRLYVFYMYSQSFGLRRWSRLKSLDQFSSLNAVNKITLIWSACNDSTRGVQMVMPVEYEVINNNRFSLCKSALYKSKYITTVFKAKNQNHKSIRKLHISDRWCWCSFPNMAKP